MRGAPAPKSFQCFCGCVACGVVSHANFVQPSLPDTGAGCKDAHADLPADAATPLRGLSGKDLPASGQLQPGCEQLQEVHVGSHANAHSQLGASQQSQDPRLQHSSPAAAAPDRSDAELQSSPPRASSIQNVEPNSPQSGRDKLTASALKRKRSKEPAKDGEDITPCMIGPEQPEPGSLQDEASQPGALRNQMTGSADGGKMEKTHLSRGLHDGAAHQQESEQQARELQPSTLPAAAQAEAISQADKCTVPDSMGDSEHGSHGRDTSQTHAQAGTDVSPSEGAAAVDEAKKSGSLQGASEQHQERGGTAANIIKDTVDAVGRLSQPDAIAVPQTVAEIAAANIPSTEVVSISNLPLLEAIAVSNVPMSEVAAMRNLPLTEIAALSNLPLTEVAMPTHIQSVPTGLNPAVETAAAATEEALHGVPATLVQSYSAPETEPHFCAPTRPDADHPAGQGNAAARVSADLAPKEVHQEEGADAEAASDVQQAGEQETALERNAADANSCRSEQQRAAASVEPSKAAPPKFLPNKQPAEAVSGHAAEQAEQPLQQPGAAAMAQSTKDIALRPTDTDVQVRYHPTLHARIQGLRLFFLLLMGIDEYILYCSPE